MKFELENVNQASLFSTAGSAVRFDIDDEGQSGTRVVLTIDETIHIHYPTKDGLATVSTLTLSPGVYACALVAVAQDIGGGRTYDTRVDINGIRVASAKGTLAHNVNNETAFEIFQLEIK